MPKDHVKWRIALASERGCVFTDTAMVTDSFVLDLCRTAGLTDAGIAYVQRVRSSQPARRVGGTRFRSVSARFASTKMGRSIQAESRTGEYPYALSLELDDDVIEFYDQPETICCCRCRGGRRRVDNYTADYLVLRTRSVEIIEVKLREQVQTTAEAYPSEWGQRQGRWFQIPVDAHFGPMGIQHWVHIGEDINSIHAANLNVLVAAKLLPSLPNEDKVWEVADRIVNSNEIATIHSLVGAVGLRDASPILRWIANGKLEAALSHQLLGEIRSARVFPSGESRDRYIAARNLRSTLPESSANCADQSGDSASDSCIEALTNRQIEHALIRYNETMQIFDAGLRPTRQQARYLRAMKAAKALGNNPLAAFAPHFERRGNRLRRITPEQDAVMQEAVRTLYATPARRSIHCVYSSIDWGQTPRATYQTFAKLVRSLPRHEVAQARSGHRAAMAVHPSSHPTVRSQMPSCAWELAHIDHTKLDEKIWAKIGLVELLERPFITILIDAWSKCVLAFWLAFSSPSASTLLMLMRDCVRRNERLSQVYITDHGAELGSAAWESFCAAHGCTKFDRPVAHPRSGSEVENFFGQLNSSLIHQLDGNMQNDQDWRKATSSHKSNATARFSLEQLYVGIDKFLFEHYNRRPHGPNPFSPLEALTQSVKDLGACCGIRQNYDEVFRIETALRSKRERYVIDGRRGIRVGEHAYWHDSLGAPGEHGKRVEVRHEPFNSSIIYAHVNGRWIICVDSRHEKLNCLEEFGRWAQASLDNGSKRFLRAAKQLADENFAKDQMNVWRRPEEKSKASKVEARVKAIPSARLRVPEADVEATQSTEESLFARLATIQILPCEELDHGRAK